MPSCPAGHPSASAQWCGVCGRPIDPVPEVPPCPGCGAPLPERFCDECGADSAVPAATLVITTDPEWFAHVRRRTNRDLADLAGPTAPRRIRLDHRRTVLGRRRHGRPAPDVDLTGDDGVSARHAALAVVDDGWTVTDLGSRNGTALGWAELVPRRPEPLPADGVVRLGLWTSVRIELSG